MESIAWRRQRLIAESLLDEKGRRALADVRARRFAKELDERKESLQRSVEKRNIDLNE